MNGWLHACLIPVPDLLVLYHIYLLFSVATALDSAKISLCTWDPICLPSDIRLRRHQGILTRQYTDVTSSSAFRSTAKRNMLTAASDVSWKHAVAGTRTANNETRKSAQITQTSNYYCAMCRIRGIKHVTRCWRGGGTYVFETFQAQNVEVIFCQTLPDT